MIETGHPILDNPKEWSTYIPAPSDVNQKKYQKKLDQIAGKSSGGLSCLRLIWGWDSRVIINGEWRQRYAFHTVTLPNGDTVDLATPRWYIEELVEPAQYREEWEQSVAELGPVPPNGFYIACYPIAVHEDGKACCYRRWEEERRRCVGGYKAPGEQELELVEYAVRERDKAKMYNRPDEPMSAEVLKECFELHYAKKQEAKDRLRAKAKACVDDFIKVFGDNFASTDPTRHRWGKYHWTAAHSKSGLLLPE
jgi:hypothetical protein